MQADYAEDSEGESPNLSLEAEQARPPIEPPKPARPKPRPVKKKPPTDVVEDSQKLLDRASNSSLDSFADIYAGPSTIADRAKTRERTSRKQTQPAGPTIEVLELTSDDSNDYDELLPSQPKKTKTRTKQKEKEKTKPKSPPRQPLPRPRYASPLSDPVYGDGAIPPTFPDAPPPLVAPAPPTNPYSIPSAPDVGPYSLTPTHHGSRNIDEEDDLLPSLPSLPRDDPITFSPKSANSYPTPGFFATSSSSVPFPASANDSGIADVSISTSCIQSEGAAAAIDDVIEHPKATKVPSSKGKGKDAPSKTKNTKKSGKANKTKNKVPMDDDDDELNSIPIPPRPIVEIRTRSPGKPRQKPISNSSSELSSVPPSDDEVQLELPKPASKRKVIPHSDDENPIPTKKSKKAPTKKSKGKQKALSDDEHVADLPPSPKPAKKRANKAKGKGKAKEQQPVEEPTKELNLPDTSISEIPSSSLPPGSTPPQLEPVSTSSPPIPKPSALMQTPIRPSSITRRRTSTPMSELIRKVNSQPSSVFVSSPAAKSGGNKTAYSPYAKTSRSMLSRIAPLHPNRKDPPPPPPPPPPRKKTKKELEREERWEEELVESVGGIEQWICLTDEERKEMRRAKRQMEMSGWED